MPPAAAVRWALVVLGLSHTASVRAGFAGHAGRALQQARNDSAPVVIETQAAFDPGQPGARLRVCAFHAPPLVQCPASPHASGGALFPCNLRVHASLSLSLSFSFSPPLALFLSLSLSLSLCARAPVSDRSPDPRRAPLCAGEGSEEVKWRSVALLAGEEWEKVCVANLDAAKAGVMSGSCDLVLSAPVMADSMPDLAFSQPTFSGTHAASCLCSTALQYSGACLIARVCLNSRRNSSGD